MMPLFPNIEPYAHSTLDVGDGHRLYYELAGNPEGQPALVVHGGPGAGCTPYHRRLFDPRVFKIVLFDQRGAGRSQPLASTTANTTQHLIGDIEHLRRHLHVKSWLVYGGSWGSTLAIAYASAHPQQCKALVTRGIWLCRQQDLDWGFGGLGAFFPEAWNTFIGHLEPGERSDPLAAYHARLVHPDPAIHLPAAIRFVAWEQSAERLVGGGETPSLSKETLAMARLEADYWINGCFLGGSSLLERAAAMAHLPGEIVHGRYDMLCPPDGAFELAEVWQGARLTMVEAAGHGLDEPGIEAAVIAAIGRFAA